jgi:ATP-dependent helicase/nuclease subunit A
MTPYVGGTQTTQDKRQFAPAKVSVSQLGRLEAEPFYPKETAPRPSIPDGSAGGAKVGTLLHSVLQQVEYARLSADREAMKCYADELLEEMTKQGFITEEERDLVPVGTLVDYFTSHFALNLSRAEWMMREVPFTFLCPWKELTGEDLPGETAVQGVMDCVAQIDGRITLVDFKSDRVGEDYGHYSERYKTQISVYREACLRAFGKMPDEVYLYYLRGGHPERIVL